MQDLGVSLKLPAMKIGTWADEEEEGEGEEEDEEDGSGHWDEDKLARGQARLAKRAAPRTVTPRGSAVLFNAPQVRGEIGKGMYDSELAGAERLPWCCTVQQICELQGGRAWQLNTQSNDSHSSSSGCVVLTTVALRKCNLE